MSSVDGRVVVDVILGAGVLNGFSASAVLTVSGPDRHDGAGVVNGFSTSSLGGISINTPARGSLPSATGIRTLHAE